MDLGLNGRTAIVTGASRGIGLAVTQGLVAEGARVIAGARTSSSELDALRDEGSVRVVELDLTEATAPARLVEAAGDLIDVLVNNVGSAPARTGGFLEVSDDDWAATFELNLVPAVRTIRSALPLMMAAGRGSIVNVGSVNAWLSDPAVIDYSAAKAALASLAKALSKEVGPRGIRVNTVSPGPVATDLWLGDQGVAATVARATGAKPEEIADQAAHQSATGRFTRPQEVADLVLLLASDRTANVTGSSFTIDGGLVPTW